MPHDFRRIAERHKDEIVDLYSRFAAAEIGRHVE